MHAASPASAGAVGLTADAIGDGLRFLRNHGWRMMVWFVCLLLPLWGFASLVGEYHEKAAFPFDAPILNELHDFETPALDRFFIFVSRLGYLWGVVPVDVLLLVIFVMRRRFRDGLFFGIAVIGSAILNIAAKNYFARARPDLWVSLMPETTYSFPSGHAMGSVTLGVAMVLLYWPTRLRWPIALGTAVFVLLVGISRVYLGVHYPSDILAGWTAAMAWTMGMYLLVDQKAPPPPASAAPNRDTVGATSERLRC